MSLTSKPQSFELRAGHCRLLNHLFCNRISHTQMGIPVALGSKHENTSCKLVQLTQTSKHRSGSRERKWKKNCGAHFQAWRRLWTLSGQQSCRFSMISFSPLPKKVTLMVVLMVWASSDDQKVAHPNSVWFTARFLLVFFLSHLKYILKNFLKLIIILCTNTFVLVLYCFHYWSSLMWCQEEKRKQKQDVLLCYKL